MKKVIITLALFVLTLAADAQQVKVESSLSSMEMLVGEQVEMSVKVTAGKDATVEFPQEALLPTNIEVLGFVDSPDQEVDGDQVCRQRNYVLTSFDDTLYYLPPFKVKVNGQEYSTNQLALKVLTIDVDTTKVDEYFGPKDVQDNPFDWELDDFATPFWLSVLFVALMALFFYLYLRLRDNKPIIARIRIVKRLLPHQKAMKAIEEIKADKMVTSDDPKEYYTRLTDTLRKYIEERYGFNAMEMTSSEIIDQLMKNADQESLSELRQLFLTADLVKFAKYSTLIHANDANLVNAVDFINKTKIEQPVNTEPAKPELTVEEQRSKRSRTALQITLCAIAVSCVALFGYILYCIYEIL